MYKQLSVQSAPAEPGDIEDSAELDEHRTLIQPNDEDGIRDAAADRSLVQSYDWASFAQALGILSAIGVIFSIIWKLHNAPLYPSDHSI